VSDIFLAGFLRSFIKQRRASKEEMCYGLGEIPPAQLKKNQEEE